MGDNRPSVYVEEDKVVYRASSVGGCVRALVASINYDEVRKQEHQDLLDRSAREGDLHEGAIRDHFVSEGWRIITEQELVEIQVIPGVVIRGRTDGVLGRPDDPAYAVWTDEVLFEAKSMSTKQFAKWSSGKFRDFTRYAYQITAYMMANPGRDVLYAVKRREDGILEVLRIPHDQPPVPFSDIKKKVLAAEKARRKDDLPSCDVNTWGCPFFYLPEEDDGDSILDDNLTDDEKAVMADLVNRYLELKAIEDAGKEAGEKRKAELNKPLTNMLGDADRVVFEFDGVKYQVTKVPGSGKRFDKAGLKAEIGDALVEKYETKYTYTYPVVRVLDDEE